MTRHHGASKSSLQPPGKVYETQEATVESVPPGVDSPVQPPDQGPTLQRPVLEIPLDKHASMARRNQARFLERLSAIKAARGERDEVTVYAKKRYTGTGWRSRQRLERDKDTDGEDEGDDTMAMGGGDGDDDQDGDEAGDRRYRRTKATAPPSRAARQRKPRSRGPGRRGRAGLFRDYRPSKEMTNGGDTFRRHGPSDERRAPTASDRGAHISVPTPQNWSQLIDPRIESTGHSPAVADADPTTGPSSVAIEKGVGNQDETEDVPMEDV